MNFPSEFKTRGERCITVLSNMDVPLAVKRKVTIPIFNMFLDGIVHNFTCQLPDGVGGGGRVTIHTRLLIYPHPPIVPEKKK